jgi:RNA-directed DNA polymerase
VKETQLQMPLPGVPQAKQGREVPQKWAWTEASVWTERMLATLERGIKGGKWFSLIDKVWKMENLQSATEQVLRNKGGAGVDGQSCEQYRQQAPERLVRLQEKIKSGSYTPPPVKRSLDPKAGEQGTSSVGHTDGGGSHRPNSGAKCDRADFREHLCRTQLRIQAGPGG